MKTFILFLISFSFSLLSYGQGNVIIVPNRPGGGVGGTNIVPINLTQFNTNDGVVSFKSGAQVTNLNAYGTTAILGSTIARTNSSPIDFWHDSNAAVDEKNWRWRTFADYMALELINDANTVNNTELTFTRVGVVADYFNWFGSNAFFNGNVGIRGKLLLTNSALDKFLVSGVDGLVTNSIFGPSDIGGSGSGIATLNGNGTNTTLRAVTITGVQTNNSAIFAGITYNAGGIMFNGGTNVENKKFAVRFSDYYGTNPITAFTGDDSSTSYLNLGGTGSSGEQAPEYIQFTAGARETFGVAPQWRFQRGTYPGSSTKIGQFVPLQLTNVIGSSASPVKDIHSGSVIFSGEWYGLSIKGGLADPEGSVQGLKGSLYLRDQVGIYEKTTGSGVGSTTGWVLIGNGGAFIPNLNGNGTNTSIYTQFFVGTTATNTPSNILTKWSHTNLYSLVLDQNPTSTIRRNGVIAVSDASGTNRAPAVGIIMTAGNTSGHDIWIGGDTNAGITGITNVMQSVYLSSQGKARFRIVDNTLYPTENVTQILGSDGFRFSGVFSQDYNLGPFASKIRWFTGTDAGFSTFSGDGPGSMVFKVGSTNPNNMWLVKTNFSTDSSGFTPIPLADLANLSGSTSGLQGQINNKINITNGYSFGPFTNQGGIWSTNTASTNFLAGLVGIGTNNPTYRLELFGTNANRRTIAINSVPVAYVPDQATNLFFGSLAIGNGLRNLSYSSSPEGQYNTAVGIDALKANTSGYFNTALGYGAMASNTVGIYSVAVGQGALRNNTSGVNNVAVGVSALYNNTTANYNTAVGLDALQYNTTGTDNTSVGKRANWQNITGNNNVSVGSDSMYSHLTGSGNVGIGQQALYSDTNGTFNTGIGLSALFSAYGSSQNTAIGRIALFNLTSGGFNTSIGSQSARYQADGVTALTAAASCVYIGYNVQGFNDSDNNSIVIGAQAKGIGANTAVLGNDSIVTTSLKGRVTVNNVINLKNYTVATLPAGVSGDVAYVTDATAPTYLGALIGGGAVVVPVFYNGSAWVSH